MASKFVIISKSQPASYSWRLLDKDGDLVLRSPEPFETEAKARQDIARVKKAAGRFTPVEVRTEE